MRQSGNVLSLVFVSFQWIKFVKYEYWQIELKEDSGILRNCLFIKACSVLQIKMNAQNFYENKKN